MSFLKFSAILYVIGWFVERFWPLLLALVIYWVIKKQWQEIKKRFRG